MASSPSGYRFASFTPDDHSAVLWVASLLALTYSILVLAVRLGFVKLRAHGLDDVVLALAHLLGIAMWGLLFAAFSNGLGKSFDGLDDAKISQVQQSFFASRILLYVALTLSKCSILILVQAVFKRNSKLAHIVNGTITVVAIWGLIGILASSIGCPPARAIPRSGSGYCVNSIPWLKAVAAGDVLTELFIIFLPVMGFYDTLMPLKRRVTVILAFSTRTPNIVFALMYMLAYVRFVNNKQPPINIVSTIAWQNVLLSYNLMSATIPSLKGFTQGFMTAGVALGYEKEGTTTIGSGAIRSGTHQSYELRSLTKLKSGSNVPPRESPVGATALQDDTKQRSTRMIAAKEGGAQCYHEESASIASHDSRQIMIKREWKVSKD